MKKSEKAIITSPMKRKNIFVLSKLVQYNISPMTTAKQSIKKRPITNMPRECLCPESRIVINKVSRSIIKVNMSPILFFMVIDCMSDSLLNVR